MYAFNKKLTAGIVGMGNDNTKEKARKNTATSAAEK